MNDKLNKKVVVIIPARSGSKGIKNKNIISVCDKPLIYWSIQHALNSKYISSVWVSSDGEEILDLARKYGANTIKRPQLISGNSASSESAWIHAYEEIKKQGEEFDLILGMQATSPIRESKDLDAAIEKFVDCGYDSLFSACSIKDFFIWKRVDKKYTPVNYDANNRKHRQDIEKSFLENGSFYLFKSDMFLKKKNRLFGKIGVYEMEDHKMFQIDEPSDVKLCESIMKGYGLDIKSVKF
jgi:CMP-N,N'-diacetyllegionaminic acid synthase